MQDEYKRNPTLGKMIKDLKDMEKGDRGVKNPTLTKMKQDLKKMEAGTVRNNSNSSEHPLIMQGKMPSHIIKQEYQNTPVAELLRGAGNENSDCLHCKNKQLIVSLRAILEKFDKTII